jgi:hypothetical protein
MANPNPNPATRFQKGKSGHEGHFGPYRKTISRSLHVASLAEAQAKPNAFKGTPRDFLLAAMTDPDVDYQVRLAAAGSLLRDSKDFEKDDKLTPAERRKRIVELVQKLAMGDAADSHPSNSPLKPAASRQLLIASLGQPTT